MPSNSIVEQNGRKYRSKKQRPCDLCRSRKTHCRIMGSEATCELCKKLSRQCTFVQKPLRRAQNPQTNSENIGRPQPNVMSVGESQHDPGLRPLPMPGHDESNSTTIENSSFWLPQLDWSAMNLSSIGQKYPVLSSLTPQLTFSKAWWTRGSVPELKSSLWITHCTKMSIC